MSCESIRAELVAYLHDELSAPRRTEVQQHLDGCRECSAELDGFRQTQKAVGQLRVNTASTGFEEKVQERIAAKVAELRARGSIRFRTGRERNAEAAKWPGLAAWLGQRRRALWLFLIAAVPVLGLFALVWFGIAAPYYRDLEVRKEEAKRQREEQLKGESFRRRRDAPRLELKATADGRVQGVGLLGSEAVRLVPVIEPETELRPEGRCVYVFTPAQWRTFLGQENVRRGTPLYQAWQDMVAAASEVLPDQGTLYLPPRCFRQLLAGPGEVSVLTLPDHYEIWDRSDLDQYLRPSITITPAPAPAPAPPPEKPGP